MSPITTAIIGLGNITHGYEDIPSMKKRMKYPTHLSVLKKDKRFKLVAASDVSAGQRRLFKKKIPNSVKIYADYRIMLAGESIDLLVVAVPTKAHYAVCSYALRAGIKNILCEKPITRTLEEAEKLQILAKRRRARIFVNYQRSYSRGYAKFIKLAQKNKWGKILSAIVRYDNGIYNTATHFIHLLEKMFGTMQKVQSIKKLQSGSIDPNISFIAYAAALKLFFAGAAACPLEIDLNFLKKRIVLRGDSFMSSSLLDIYENIYQVMRNKKKPFGDIVSAIHALRVAVRAVQSSKSGKLLKV